MRNNDDVKTRLVYENDENRYIWESPYNDVSMEDILDAFFGMMVSATWQPITVIEAMRDFVAEHSYMLEDEDEDDYEYDEDPRPDDGFKIKEEGKNYPETTIKFDGFHNPLPLNNQDNILPKGATDITW